MFLICVLPDGRINKAPTKDFISDVGSKETHRFTYPESFMAPGPDANFVLMDFKLLDVAWLTSALTNGTVTRYCIKAQIYFTQNSPRDTLIEKCVSSTDSAVVQLITILYKRK